MALHTIAAEGESMAQKWAAVARHMLNDEAMGHLEFQKAVAKDMIALSRMVRDLARSSGTVEK